MRRALVIGFAALTLAGSLAPAEARGFRLRSFGHSSQPRSYVSSPGLAVVPALTLRTDSARSDSPASTGTVGAPIFSVRTAEALAPDEAPSLKIIMPAPVAASAPMKKDPESWCRSGRIAGSGAGFCLIN